MFLRVLHFKSTVCYERSTNSNESYKKGPTNHISAPNFQMHGVFATGFLKCILRMRMADKLNPSVKKRSTNKHSKAMTVDENGFDAVPHHVLVDDSTTNADFKSKSTDDTDSSTNQSLMPESGETANITTERVERFNFMVRNGLLCKSSFVF